MKSYRLEGDTTVVEDVVKKRGARLPHWERDGGTYFVTFRLCDSIPAQVIKGWRVEIENQQRILEECLGRKLEEKESAELRKQLAGRAEKYLDKGLGDCWLSRPGCAEVVQGAFLHHHGVRYELFAWAVMPNHAHIVFRAKPGFGLDKITHSWKSFTANKVNNLVSRSGKLWQAESFDHLIRTADGFERICNYVNDNPRHAGLKDWPWCGRLDTSEPFK